MRGSEPIFALHGPLPNGEYDLVDLRPEPEPAKPHSLDADDAPSPASTHPAVKVFFLHDSLLFAPDTTAEFIRAQLAAVCCVPEVYAALRSLGPKPILYITGPVPSGEYRLVDGRPDLAKAQRIEEPHCLPSRTRTRTAPSSRHAVEREMAKLDRRVSARAHWSRKRMRTERHLIAHYAVPASEVKDVMTLLTTNLFECKKNTCSQLALLLRWRRGEYARRPEKFRIVPYDRDQLLARLKEDLKAMEDDFYW